MAKTLMYKDLLVKQGTQLFDLVEASRGKGDDAKAAGKAAEKLYSEMKQEFKKYFPEGLPKVKNEGLFPDWSHLNTPDPT